MSEIPVMPPIQEYAPYREWFEENAKRPAKAKFFTMPTEYPEYTLGWQVAAWMMDNLVQPNGPREGQPFQPSHAQLWFLLHFYAIDPADMSFNYRGAAMRKSKGTGKSPWAAALALAELLGPVRPHKLEPAVPGGVIGKPLRAPVVSVLATARSQTENTLRMIRLFAGKNSRLAEKYGLEVGKTYIETPAGGKLNSVASSVGSAEGEETSFAVLDETEHWLPNVKGPELAATVKRNLNKTASRYIETCNAWSPGEGSVAEATYNDWLEADMLEKRKGILYDSISTPPGTVMHDDPQPGQVGLTDALKFVYSGSPWVGKNALAAIIDDIHKPSTKVSEASRFYLNHPMASEDQWITPEEWHGCAEPARFVTPEEPVVLFFDGSKSNDHTGLVGMTLDNPHIFKVGHWKPSEVDGVIDVHAVDSAILRAKERYNVVGFWADVREWESYVHQAWPEIYIDSLRKELWANPSGRVPAPVAWDMRTHTNEFAAAVEAMKTAVLDKAITHDGDAALLDHVTNAKAYEVRGRVSIRKESPKSSRKIDLAVCAAGAYALYLRATAPRDGDKVDETPFAFYV